MLELGPRDMYPSETGTGLYLNLVKLLKIAIGLPEICNYRVGQQGCVFICPSLMLLRLSVQKNSTRTFYLF